MATRTPSIGVVLITHRAKTQLARSLPLYLESPLRPRVLVVNSSSGDGTVELGKRMGAETLVIPREQFNHGATRELARRYLGTDIVCMGTPDAYPVDRFVLSRLVAPLLDGTASVAYARQVPRAGAGVLESFLRKFNYPDTSHIRGIDDVDKYGSYTFFCSDTCSAYLNSALDEVGGFRPALTHEDAFAVAMLLQKGHKIAYVADAVVQHSHPCSLWGDFERSFDTGYARSEYRDLLRFAGTDESRGRAYFAQLVKTLIGGAPFLIPFAFVHTLVRWFGYRVGTVSHGAPVWFRKLLSSQDYYWDSVEFRRPGGFLL